MEAVPSICRQVTVHAVEPSCQPMRVTNSQGVECFPVSARVRASGAVVFVEAPCAVGTPAAIFRDCPELEPYFPEPVTTLPWVNTSRLVNSAHIMVTTMAWCSQAERERLGLVVREQAG